MLRKSPIKIFAASLATATAALAVLPAWAQLPPGPAPTPESELPFKIQKLAQFDNASNIAFLPDGSALVAEKPGKLKHYANGKVSDIAGVPAVAYTGVPQGGLLDIALAPGFAGNHVVYFSYSEWHGPEGASGLALARAKLDGDKLSGVQLLWRSGGDGKGGQFGGVIAFAPDGKSLFLSSGERMRFTPAQDMNTTLGKIIHLTLDGKPAPDNPWAGKTGTPTIQITDPPKDTEAAKTAPTRIEKVDGPNLAPAEIWSLGHRNPYGLAFAPDGRLWEIEFGPRGGDEVNLILKGRNYGWPNVSEGPNYDGVPIPEPKPGDGYEPPKVFWTPSLAPAGLIIYTGKMFPQWKGSAFIGGMSGEGLARVAIKGTSAQKADRWNLGMRIRDVAQAPDGSIWLLQDGNNGWLMRLTPKP